MASPKQQNKRPITIRMEPQLKASVDEIALRQHESTSAVIRRLLRQGVEAAHGD